MSSPMIRASAEGPVQVVADLPPRAPTKAHPASWYNSDGASITRTNNDSRNAPMLAINQKWGYQPQPGKYYLRCQTFG